MINFDFLAVVLIFVYFKSWTVAQAPIENFEQHLQLSPLYSVTWQVNFSSQMVTFEVTAKTLGYVGFGLSTNGNMKGSDIVIGGVLNNNQTTYFDDYHGTGNTKPTLDMEQNWNPISINQNDTHTILKFDRKFETCDLKNDIPITNDQLKIIWSIGKSDMLEYHQARGIESVNLLDPPSPSLNLSNFNRWILQVNSHVPTSKDTSYWCTIHRSPQLTNKTHIVGFEIILQDEIAVQHTHHIVLHSCSKPMEMDEVKYSQEMTSWVSKDGGECHVPDDPISKLYGYCSVYFLVWAKGGQNVLLPEHVGFPIGEHGKEQFFLMEVHYDNPNFNQGTPQPIEYKTGFEILLTKPGDKLRQYDAGPLDVGHRLGPYHVIPPNVSNFVTVGHCASKCTQTAFPQDGLNVFNVLLHSHLSGRKLKLRHFRDGKELPWIMADDNYDFDYQQLRSLRKEVKLLPGDHLTQECTYDTTWMNPPSGTFGGLSTRREMCMAFMMYYPKIHTINSCSSQHHRHEYILETFGIQNMTDLFDDSPVVTQPESLKGLTYLDVMNTKVNWTKNLVEDFENELRYKNHDGICFNRAPSKQSNFVWWSGLTNYPRYAKPYEPLDTCTKASSSQSSHLRIIQLPIYFIILITSFYNLF